MEKYKKYIIRTNFRNILLELCNFENNQIIISFNDKIKDVISAIHDTTMIDFNYDDVVDNNSFLLKAYIYNLTSLTKINDIKIISFCGDTFSNIDISEIEITNTISHLIENLNIVRNAIISNKIPNMKKSAACSTCLYKKHCDIKDTVKKTTNKVGYKTKNQPIKLKNNFIL